MFQIHFYKVPVFVQAEPVAIERRRQSQPPNCEELSGSGEMLDVPYSADVQAEAIALLADSGKYTLGQDSLTFELLEVLDNQHDLPFAVAKAVDEAIKVVDLRVKPPLA